MERNIMNDLIKWKESKRRKPLVMLGARQVGKTWILEEFGKSFPDGYVKVNFDKQPELHQFFQTTKDVNRIIQNLSFALGQPITKQTLIFFDEIQECEDALNTLKYFCEDAPEYYVVSAGSLLGLMLAKGFPVGKVDFMRLTPMTFEEFLKANGDNNLVEYMKSIDSIETIPDIFNGPLLEKLKMYYIIGGMPEAVKVWCEERDIKEVDRVQSEILEAYEHDFAKHAESTDVPKIRLIWNSLPSQLARENKKFLYSVVKKGARAREYENALNWLKNADLVKKVPRITKPGIPLSAYEDLQAFKIYMVDVGLLRRHAHLASSAFSEENRLFEEFKGALNENYVLECIQNIPDVSIYYWSEIPYEVDFIIQLDNDVVPLEAKAGKNIKSASIKNYAEEYKKQTKLCVRLSTRNLSYDGNMLNVPLYLADELERIINIAIKKKQ
ncbi:MAG: ATP-binding protein [Clostridia bacterium]|nr:ATP-binding protein [Clostridia bacterium]MBQ6467398.1 ATP-binding protein [Clostridia bacterium]